MLFFHLIKEDSKEESKDIPLYKKIYNKIKKIIINGSIPNNTQLPSSRELAKYLHISRSTVIKTYELLTFERLIIPKKGSGFLVSYVYDLPHNKKELKTTIDNLEADAEKVEDKLITAMKELQESIDKQIKTTLANPLSQMTK